MLDSDAQKLDEEKVRLARRIRVDTNDLIPHLDQNHPYVQKSTALLQEYEGLNDIEPKINLLRAGAQSNCGTYETEAHKCFYP